MLPGQRWRSRARACEHTVRRRVGCCQFSDVSCKAVFNPGDDLQERILAYLSAIAGRVDIRKHQQMTLSNVPCFWQWPLDCAGENGGAALAEHQFPIVSGVTDGSLAKPAHISLLTPLFDRQFHAAPNVNFQRTMTRLGQRYAGKFCPLNSCLCLSGYLVSGSVPIA